MVILANANIIIWYPQLSRPWKVLAAWSSSSVAHVMQMWCMRVCWARAHRRPPPKQDGRPGELNAAAVSGGCSGVGQRPRRARGRPPRTTSHHAHTHTHLTSATTNGREDNGRKSIILFCYARSRSRSSLSHRRPPKHTLRIPKYYTRNVYVQRDLPYIHTHYGRVPTPSHFIRLWRLAVENSTCSIIYY